jgi:dTDP-4-amino-4,6-dideoxygalactose transaminase
MSRLAVLGGEPVRTQPWPSCPVLTAREAASVGRVLRASTWSSLPGDEEAQDPLPDLPPTSLSHRDRLEREMARAHGARFGVAVASGTTALTLALRALGLDPGDEVLVPAYGCVAPEMAVLAAGGVPVHVDICPGCYAIDPTAIPPVLTDRTRAVIVVHFAGRPADVRAAGAAAPGVPVVEDACLAPGAARDGQPVGALGRAAVFSFGVDKPLHAGEGGLVVTDDLRVATRCRRLRSLGLDPEMGDHLMPAGSHRLSELQAAALLPQWQRRERDRQRRERNARRIEAALAGCELLRPLAELGTDAIDARAQLWLRYDESGAGVSRGDFVDAVQAEGVPIYAGWERPNYACALFTAQRAGRWLAERGSPRPADCYERCVCPNAERAAFGEACLFPLRILGAPVRDVADVCRALEKVLTQLPALRAHRASTQAGRSGRQPSAAGAPRSMGFRSSGARRP